MLILAGVATFFLCGNAVAVPWVWTDNIDDLHYVSVGNPYDYVHQLYGFDPGEDFLSTYCLEISLSDDGTDGREIAKIDLPGIVADGYYNFSYESNTYGISLLGWIQLQTSGLLDVTIKATRGDFNFVYSHLTAYGCESEPYSVTEPGAMMVLGAGLFGLAGCARKRFKR
jgi:hypothetical protein